MKTIKNHWQNMKSLYIIIDIIIMILSIIFIGSIWGGWNIVSVPYWVYGLYNIIKVMIIKDLRKKNAANEKYKGGLITFWLVLSIIIAIMPYALTLFIMFAYSMGMGA